MVPTLRFDSSGGFLPFPRHVISGFPDGFGYVYGPLFCHGIGGTVVQGAVVTAVDGAGLDVVAVMLGSCAGEISFFGIIGQNIGRQLIVGRIVVFDDDGRLVDIGSMPHMAIYENDLVVIIKGGREIECLARKRDEKEADGKEQGHHQF